MTRGEFLKNYWAYYLMLEKRFIYTLNYVELTENNFGTFSNEYAAMLQLVGAELDSFYKVYCGFAASEIKNIADYARYIIDNEPEVLLKEVSVNRTNLTVKPLSGWVKEQAKQSLFWWQAYDNIKHGRVDNKTDASQKCVLYALATLFILETMYIAKISCVPDELDVPDEPSMLFQLKGWHTTYTNVGGNLYVTLEEKNNLL